MFFVLKLVVENLVILVLLFVVIKVVLVFNKGIVWCCMLEFISVWLVLLFFKNGIYLVVIDIICLDEILIKLILLGLFRM